MAEAIRTRMTLQEYLDMPETMQITQLIDGELVVNPPFDKHQKTGPD